jgi:hypothetical protein
LRAGQAGFQAALLVEFLDAGLGAVMREAEREAADGALWFRLNRSDWHEIHDSGPDMAADEEQYGKWRRRLTAGGCGRKVSYLEASDGVRRYKAILPGGGHPRRSLSGCERII